jgi:hypothetical protein
MLTLEKAHGATVDSRLRDRFPQLPDPLVLPWSELPVLGLDRETPWLYGPIERDPLAAPHGRTVVPRREIRRLRKLAAWDVPFQRIAVAHELDPDGAVRDLLPELRTGPRTCTDAVATAVVGPQPVHPAVRGTARLLDAIAGRGVGTAMARALATALDPIIFGVVGMPETVQGEPALFYPLSAWRW